MVAKKRDMCTACPVNSITQGSIFNNAANEDFGGGDDLGLLISARCDLANNKARKYSYLPVITLEKYISYFLVDKLLREQRLGEISKVKDLIRAEGESPETVDHYGVEPSINRLINKPKAKDKAMKCLKNINDIKALESKGWGGLSGGELALIPPKKILQELKFLSENKTEGFFLIDEVRDFNNSGESLGPHVILLREVHHMSALVSDYLREGCDHDTLIGNSMPGHPIKLKSGGFSYVLCNINSPYIELIMQRFSNLFTRIGVSNPAKKMVDEFLEKYIAE